MPSWREGCCEMSVYITSCDRISGELANTDRIMNDTLWFGVYPGLAESMLDFVCEKMEAFFCVNF